MVQRRITDTPTVQLGQRPTSIIPHFYVGCPSCCNPPNLSWLGTGPGICWIAYPRGRKENEVELQRAEMRMVRWMCNVKVKDRVPSKELRERLGINDIILILQQQVAMVWACAVKRRH